MVDLGQILLYIVIWGAIFWVLWWGLKTINPPEPWMKVGTVVLVVATVLVLINLLASFLGTPIWRWRA